MKTFVLTDESINSHGFAIDLSKLSLERFKQNPVMLYNHHELVGKWENLKIEDGKLLGDPSFMEDDSEELSIKVKKRVDQGFVKAASLGINIISVDHTNGKPTVEAEVYECSIVDIPSNANAVTLYSSDYVKLEGKDLTAQLSAIKPNTKIQLNMKLNANSYQTLGLDTGADDAAIDNAIKALSEKNKAQKLKLDTIQTEKVDALISTALSAGKITASTKETFVKLANSDFELAKSTIELLEGKKKLSGREKSETGGSTEDKDKWTFADWRKKDTAGLLAIKKDDPDLYEEILNR